MKMKYNLPSDEDSTEESVQTEQEYGSVSGSAMGSFHQSETQSQGDKLSLYQVI